MPTLWVANLDAEWSWQVLPKPAPTQPLRLRARLAAVGSLFRFLADEGDALWLPAPIEPTRLAPETGPATLVSDSAKKVLERFPHHRVRPWADAPPWVDGEQAAIAARVNDRRFALDVARRLGVADERARRVTHVEAVLEHATCRRIERWVVKAPFSASGRERHVHIEGTIEESRGPVERLLAKHGELIFEPWHERVCDVGVLFDCPLSGEPVAHRQIINPSGAVRAIELDVEVPDVEIPVELIDTARRVAAELTAAGYRGPAGIDAWLHEEHGERRWHLLGEINARWSVGRLAREIAGEAGHRRLGIGTHRAFEAAVGDAGFRCLVRPSTKDPGLWLT